MDALWILVEELQKWDFSSKIPHICLGTSKRGADSQQIAELVRVWITESGRRRCRDIIQRTVEAAELTGYEWWLTALDLAFGSKTTRPGMISSLGLSLMFAMFAMTPTIGKLVLSLSTAVNYDVVRSLFGHAKFPPQQWHLPVHQIIRKRIETLELTKDISMLVSYQNKRAPWLCPHSTQHLSFAPFDNLRRLSVPFQVLLIEPVAERLHDYHGRNGVPPLTFTVNHLANPARILPPSLETLRLEDCTFNRSRYRFWEDGLQFVAKLAHDKSRFSQVQLIQLVFDEALVPTARWMRLYGTAPQVSTRIQRFRDMHASLRPKIETLFAQWRLGERGPQHMRPKAYAVEEIAPIMGICDRALRKLPSPQNAEARLQVRHWDLAMAVRKSAEERAGLPRTSGEGL